MLEFDLLNYLDDVFTADEQQFLQAILIEDIAPPKKKRVCRRKLCSAPANGYGYCAKHTKVCKIDGCTKSTQSKGLCFRHGGGQRCKVPNCNKSIQLNGLCISHGAKSPQAARKFKTKSVELEIMSL